MNDTTLISDLVRAGLDPELVARVSNALVAVAQSGGIRVESTTEKRRAWDREYRRRKASIPPEFHPIPPETPNAPLTKEVSKNLTKEVSKKSFKKERASRIPPDWLPSEVDSTFALSKGMLAERIQIEADKFRNYWTAKSGTAAAKLDWSATWRNWVLFAIERNPPANPPRAPPDGKPTFLTAPPGCETYAEFNARVAAAREPNGSEGRTPVRKNSGVGTNGTDQHSELPLSGGAPLLDQDRRSSG